jgi:flagellar FliL protein
VKKLVRYVVLLVVQGGLAYALTIFLIVPWLTGQPLPWQAKPTEETEETGERQELGPLVPIEGVLVNVAGTKGRRFCKASLTLEAEGPAQSKEAELRMPVVRGLIIEILASKNLDELVTPTARDLLREEILAALNEDATEGGFRDLYFTEYLVQ